MPDNDPAVSPEEEAAATPAPVARFVTDKPRSATVPLAWPVEHDGRLYTHITIRRLTGREVSDYYLRVQAGGPDAPRYAPIYDAPDAVMDQLDADDDEAVTLAAQPLMPRSFRALLGLEVAPQAADTPTA